MALSFSNGVRISSSAILRSSTPYTLYKNAANVIQYVVVAGGGGGGYQNGGGGGAGGVVYSTETTISINSLFAIVVGGGGTGAMDHTSIGTVGSNSSFIGTAFGGGGGGTYNGASSLPGSPGGSGGGGAGTGSGQTSLKGSATQSVASYINLGLGWAGGSGWAQDSLGSAGGGGGAGGYGANGAAGVSGAGGVGSNLFSSLLSAANTGSNVSGVWYIGGGGGGGYVGSGAGGYGGGGVGGSTGGNGNVSTGGGGGGGNGVVGGTGGSGVVIISHSNIYATARTTGNPVIIDSTGNIIYTFWQSGTINFLPQVPFYASNTTTTLVPGPILSNVTLLLTNNNVANTFITDVSSYAANIVPNGTGLINDTFNPFQPGDGYYSGYFNGSSFLSMSSSASFAVGTIFTMECWFYPVSQAGSLMMGTVGTAAPQIGWANSTTFGVATVSNAFKLTSTTLPISNTWNHVAVVRSGTGTNQTSLFLNGIRIVNGTVTDAWSTKTGFTIGAASNSTSYFTGYISNARLVKGTAVYDTSLTTLTIPTVPLTTTQAATTSTTAIFPGATSLLALQSTSFKDNSFVNAGISNTITATGTPAANAFIPFTPPTISDIYGSGFFNGSTDYLTVPYNSQTFNFSTSNLTIECWFYATSFADNRMIAGLAAGTNNTRSWYLYLTITTGIPVFSWYPDGTNVQTLTSSTAPILNTWNHLAVTRISGTNRMFLNGAQVAIFGNQNGAMYTNASSVFTIGREAAVNGSYFTGYISNFRLLNGKAIYAGNFTVPTAPLAITQSDGSNISAIIGTETNFLTLQNNKSYNNNIFKDSSQNKFKISKSGSPYQGTFNPFNTNWSYAFDGTGDYLTSSTNVAITTGPFTIELWVYFPVLGTERHLLSNNYWNIGQNGGWLIGILSNNTLSLQRSTGVYNTYQSTMTSTGTISAGVWTHLAIVRDTNNLIKMYFNGILDAATPVSESGSLDLASVAGQVFKIGTGLYDGSYSAVMLGFISNARIVQGTAVYTGNFTPPTTQLATIQSAGASGSNIESITSGTIMLSCQSNSFKDNSVTNVPFTRAGDIKVSRFSPINKPLFYNTATDGGSIYFNGTTDYVSAPDNAALELGSSDFTIEAWIYPTIDQFAVIVCKRDSNVGNGPYTFSYALTTKVLSLIASADNTTTAVTVTGIAVTLNTWQHVAATRSGSNWTVWQNGVSTGTASYAGTIYATGTSLTTIGAFGNGANLFPGYISGARIVKGTAVYTGTFTPPTAPLTAAGATYATAYPNTANVNTTFPAANTSLLLNDTGGSIIDLSGTSSLNTVGDARLSNSQKKYGTSSIFFNGSTSYLNMLNSLENNFGTGPFTIEFWMYPTNVAVGQQALIANYLNASVGFAIQILNSKLLFGIGDTDRIVGTTTLISNNWYHVAVSGASVSIKMFLNGVQESTTYTTACTLSSTAVLSIGRILTTAYYNGYLDDIRLTHSILYPNTPFNVPTTSLYNSAAYSTTSSVDYSQLINY